MSKQQTENDTQSLLCQTCDAYSFESLARYHELAPGGTTPTNPKNNTSAHTQRKTTQSQRSTATSKTVHVWFGVPGYVGDVREVCSDEFLWCIANSTATLPENSPTDNDPSSGCRLPLPFNVCIQTSAAYYVLAANKQSQGDGYILYTLNPFP